MIQLSHEIISSLFQYVRPNREVGGYISPAGEIILICDEKCSESSVEFGTYEETREKALAGFLPFHTHPKGGSSDLSAGDIISTNITFRELLVVDDVIYLLESIKELSIEEIKIIDEECWNYGLEIEEETGESAYWFYRGRLSREIPVKIKELFRIKDEKHLL